MLIKNVSKAQHLASRHLTPSLQVAASPANLIPFYIATSPTNFILIYTLFQLKKILLNFFNYKKKTNKPPLFYLLSISLVITKIKTLNSVWKNSIKLLGGYNNKNKLSSFYRYAFTLQLIKIQVFINLSIPIVILKNILAIL